MALTDSTRYHHQRHQSHRLHRWGRQRPLARRGLRNLFVEKAVAFIEDAGNRNQAANLSVLHSTIFTCPTAECTMGASEMGPRGDAIAQVDWMTGQIVQRLERLQIDDNTLTFLPATMAPCWMTICRSGRRITRRTPSGGALAG